MGEGHPTYAHSNEPNTQWVQGSPARSSILYEICQCHYWSQRWRTTMCGANLLLTATVKQATGQWGFDNDGHKQ